MKDWYFPFLEVCSIILGVMLEMILDSMAFGSKMDSINPKIIQNPVS